jgi:hypothetical protein
MTQTIVTIIFSMLDQLVKATDNKIDDKAVELIKEILSYFNLVPAKK